MIAWGEIVYQDAFKNLRILKFGQLIVMLSDGTYMTWDTSHHNEAD